MRKISFIYFAKKKKKNSESSSLQKILRFASTKILTKYDDYFGGSSVKKKIPSINTLCMDIVYFLRAKFKCFREIQRLFPSTDLLPITGSWKTGLFDSFCHESFPRGKCRSYRASCSFKAFTKCFSFKIQSVARATRVCVCVCCVVSKLVPPDGCYSYIQLESHYYFQVVSVISVE